MNERDELLDEATLRRALRLDADEPRPRFDPRAIAAAAQVNVTRRIAIVALAASAVTGLAAATVWSIATSAAPQVFDEAVSLVVPPLVAVATVVVSFAEIASDPVVPMSLLAALGVAIVHELRERRERIHVHAS